MEKGNRDRLYSRSDPSSTDPNGLSLTFLGTSSGRSTLTRNGTSTALNFPWQSWLVDCAEGTQRQMLRAGRPTPCDIKRIFITRVCADQIFGLPALMGSIMICRDYQSPSDAVLVEIYGPAGLRAFVRASMKAVGLRLKGKYSVTELLLATDTPTTCEPDEMHPHEVPGEDIFASQDDSDTWPNFSRAPEATISAARLDGPQTSLGYVVEEPGQPFADEDYLNYLDSIPSEQLPEGMAHARQFVSRFAEPGGDSSRTLLADGTPVKPAPSTRPGRKIVILGATSNAWRIGALAQDADVVVHEATNIPIYISRLPHWLCTPKKIEEWTSPTAFRQGHSNAVTAGAFARRVNARKLVLNQFASRFTGLSKCDSAPIINRFNYGLHEYQCTAMVHHLEQAARAFGRADVHTAYDLLQLPVSFREPEIMHSESESESKLNTSSIDDQLSARGEEEDEDLSPEAMLLLSEWQSLSSPRFPAVRLRVSLPASTPPTPPSPLAPEFRFPISKNKDRAIESKGDPTFGLSPAHMAILYPIPKKKSRKKQANGETKV